MTEQQEKKVLEIAKKYIPAMNTGDDDTAPANLWNELCEVLVEGDEGDEGDE